MPTVPTAILFALAALLASLPASELIEKKSATHWAFQPIASPAPPAVTDQKWLQQPLDHFVLAKLEAANLTPSAPTERSTLIRRAFITLTGLQPTFEQTQAFIDDPAPDAYAKVIDQLLASPQYGERWARHWLDVARYADTKGYVFEEARQYPHAYTYRDWVIRSLNEDMPYDQFLTYQIAADRIVKTDADKKHLAAMGFLTVGRRFLNRQPDIIDDRIDVLTRGIMALTVACSRCHDHKYDPIPTADYYSLYGVFASSEEPKELPLLGERTETEATRDYEKQLAEKRAKIDTHLQKRLDDQRKEKQLKNYLIAVSDGRAMNDAELKKMASDRGLVQSFLLRWRDFIKAKPDDDPIFGAWKTCFNIPAEKFAIDAPQRLLSTFQNPKTNPRVTLALKDKKLNDISKLAAAYAELFAHDNASEPHAKPEREQIRQTLYGKGTPNDIPLGRLLGQLPTPDQQHVRKLRREVANHETEHPGAPPRGMVMLDREKPVEPVVFIRGQEGNRGPKVARQSPAIIAGKNRTPFPDNTSGRLEMAQHITSPANPLTARVIVNRIWLQHFGQALVSTPSDFGLRSDPPSHPELLDFLASQFVREGWSLKKLHRHLLLSAAYQQSSAHDPKKATIDPANQLYWRANRQRLDFEALRDSLIQASGQLDAAMFGRPYNIANRPFTTRRTIYSEVERQNLENVFRTFDFASPDAHCAERHETTVPQQALFMMNSPFIEELATKLAGSLSEGKPEEKILQLYRQLFSRNPSPIELAVGQQFITQTPTDPRASADFDYGYGSFEGGKVQFNRLKESHGAGYRHSPNLPDPDTGWVHFHQYGGHPGHGAHYKAILRFTAPEKGDYNIKTSIAVPSNMSDGITITAVANYIDQLATKILTPTEDHEFKVENVPLEAGATLDLVVGCHQTDTSDSFLWNPTITSAGQKWIYEQEIKSPPRRPTPWKQYAQALLSTNEFAFVD